MKKAELVTVSRCSAGKRWFWVVMPDSVTAFGDMLMFNKPLPAEGYSASAEDAEQDAANAASSLGRPVVWCDNANGTHNRAWHAKQVLGCRRIEKQLAKQ